MEPITAVEVWSLPACPRCAEAKERLRAAGIEVVERDLKSLMEWKPRAVAVAVLAQSTMQGGVAPVLRVVREGEARSDEFVEYADLESWLAGDQGES